MKIALCLYGYFNNRADHKSGSKGYQYLKNNVFKKQKDIDVFIHSWEPSLKDQLIDLYNPVDYIFEDQLDFEEIYKENDIDKNYIDKNFNRGKTKYKPCKIESSLSFFYSRGKSINLTKDKKYDIVIACRFDIGHRSRIHRRYNVSQMIFHPDLNMDYIYSAMWVQTNAGYADQWFYSNQENMLHFAKFYEKSLDYFKPQSEYEKSITKGWFDSNAKDEFSNEMFKEEKSSNLVKYPRWQMINNHIMHKWFMKDVGLYAKSKFVSHRGKVYG